MILLPNHERGTIILVELPYSLAIAVISDTCRVERRFNFGPSLGLFIIHLYYHPNVIRLESWDSIFGDLIGGISHYKRDQYLHTNINDDGRP
jgi:hypothetical protein